MTSLKRERVFDALRAANGSRREADLIPRKDQAEVAGQTRGRTRHSRSSDAPEVLDTVLVPARRRMAALGYKSEMARALVGQDRVAGLVRCVAEDSGTCFLKLSPANANVLPAGQACVPSEITVLTLSEWAKRGGLSHPVAKWLADQGHIRTWGMAASRSFVVADLPLPQPRLVERARRCAQRCAQHWRGADYVIYLLSIGKPVKFIMRLTGRSYGFVHQIASQARRQGKLPLLARNATRPDQAAVYPDLKLSRQACTAPDAFAGYSYNGAFSEAERRLKAGAHQGCCLTCRLHRWADESCPAAVFRPGNEPKPERMSVQSAEAM